MPQNPIQQSLELSSYLYTKSEGAEEHLITLTCRGCRVQLLTDPWAVNLVTTPIANGIVLLLQSATPVPQLNFGGQLLSSLVPALPENLNQGRPELIISVVSQFGCPLIGLIQLPE